MNRISRFFIISLLTLVWSATPSLAQKRIALVIGNSNYTKLQSLPNPGNDSQLMAQTLRKLGFDVISAVDADRISISRAVRKFGKALRASGKDTVGLFYYAGHGVQARGENYLIPLGAEVDDEADLDVEAIATSVVLAQMEAAGNVLNLVILDACRNNPFKGRMRSSSRGLVRLNAASGSLVAFAAAPGQVASDGNDENSPYTKALVASMQIPGLSVEQMFKRVRVAVETQTNRQQTPWEESSLRGDFFFTPKRVESKQVLNDVGQEWFNIQNTRSTAVLKAFIKSHPQSVYTRYARAALEEKLTTDTARKRVLAKPGTEALASIEKQRQRDNNAMEISFWNSIQSSNNYDLYKDYITRYPQGNFIVIANVRLAAAAKRQADELKVASLQPEENSDPVSKPALPLLLGQRELTISLQQELSRVGCKPGKVDGKWGSKGRRALAQFKKFASLSLPYEDISPEVIDAVKQQRSRVCPKSKPVKVRKNPAPIKSTAKKIRRNAGGAYYFNYNAGTSHKTWSSCVTAAYAPSYCEKRFR